MCFFLIFLHFLGKTHFFAGLLTVRRTGRIFFFCDKIYSSSKQNFILFAVHAAMPAGICPFLPAVWLAMRPGLLLGF